MKKKPKEFTAWLLWDKYFDSPLDIIRWTKEQILAAGFCFKNVKPIKVKIKVVEE